jgi:hypothetical protein
VARGALLTESFRARISGRERRGEFPFNVHNIYRVILAVEPVLFDGWAAVAARQPLTAGDRTLGTSLRCFRYLHVLLVASCHADPAVLTSFLGPIACRALGMLHEPACFCEGHFASARTVPEISPDLALRLASCLRQYADVRWLGQHDQGFIGWPLATTPEEGVAYTRCFGRLPAGVPHDSVRITVTYDLDSDADLAFDTFRGELTMPPPRESIERCVVFDGGTQQALDETECVGLLARARSSLRAARSSLPSGTGEGNRAVADLFLTELLAAGQRVDLDGRLWRAAARARLDDLMPRGAATMTELYLDRLGAAFERWDAYLAVAAN